MEIKRIVYIVVGLLLVTLLVIQLVFFYTNRKGASITPDEGSISRMQTMNQLLRSYLGVNWSVVLTLIIVLILVILVMMYFLTKKDIGHNSFYRLI